MNFEEIKLKIRMNMSVTYLLIGVNVILFIVSLLLTVRFGNQTISLLSLGAEYVPNILDGEVWRMIMPSFLHAGVFHLAFNMFALLQLGKLVESFYGPRKLLIVYVVTGFFGSVLSVAAALYSGYNHQDATFGISVGASAAIFGLIGLLIGNKFKSNAYEVSIDSYVNTSSLIFFVGYNILIGLGINFFGTSVSINNFAHIGGLLSGIVLGSQMSLLQNYDNSKHRKKLVKSVYYLMLVVLLLSFSAMLLNLLPNILI